MAYETSNPPSLLTQRIGGTGAVWSYVDGDGLDDVLEVNYIANATDLGIKAGDTVIHRDSTDLVTTELVVNAQRTPGTASGALCSAVEPIGETSIALQSVGSGTFLIDDIITFDNDPVTEYLLTTGDADITGGGTLVITPGLVVATEVGTKIAIKTDVLNLSSGKSGFNLEASLAATQLITPSESGSMFLFDRAGGVTYTLPAAVAGLEYWFATTVDLTSGVYKIACASGDFFLGAVNGAIEGAATGEMHFADGTADLSISMNSTTQGGLIGGWLHIRAISGVIWQIEGVLSCTATPLTPFLTS